MGSILWDHPKLVDKWAKRYIKLYREVSSEEAKKWALEFLRAPQRQLMVERVKTLLGHNKNKNS